MSRATREAVFAALFAQLQAVPGLTLVSRRLKNTQDIAAEDFPAAFQVQGPQKIIYKGGVPAVLDMEVSWVLSVNNDDPSSAPSTDLNNLIDAACAQIAPAPGFERQDLGGLVEYCAVEGTIDVVEGVLGNRAVAVIPIRIVMAGF